MNITITGNLGSGKTSVCKELAKAGFAIVSAGDIFREIAAEKGMTVIELNEAAKSDRSVDDLLDQRSTQLGKELDHTVFDSRLAWHFVESSFKVFLLVDTQEAANRVFAGGSRGAEEYQDAAQAGAGLKARAQLEQARFADLYGIDYYDAGNYDLIIESSHAAPDQIAQEIIRNFELYQDSPFSAKVELNLKCLYPSISYEMLDHDRLEQRRQELLGRGTGNGTGLCTDGQMDVLCQNGSYYVTGTDGHYRVFAGIAAGKVFADIRRIQDGPTVQADAQPLPGLEGYESFGGFHYRFDPAQASDKPGYMIDFSKVFE